MILNYVEMENQYTTNFNKKGLDIHILKPDDFEDYKKAVEESGNKVTVVGNTKLKSVKGDNDNYIIIQGKKFEVTDGKMCSAKGYIPVGNNQFVRLEKTYLVGVIIAVACGIAACGVIAGLAIALPLQQSVPATTSSLLMESGSDWNGQQHLNGEGSISSQENTSIPGYAQVSAGKDRPYLSLYNPPENTVNFVYTITKPMDTVQEDTFTTAEQAQNYINSHAVTYENYYNSETNGYQLKDSNGNVTDILTEYKSIANTDGTYTVIKVTSKIIYFTNGITPGKAVDWNVYDFLGQGSHKVQVRISTYDVETNVQCYGAIQDTTITVS